MNHEEKINNIQFEALTRQTSSRTYRLIDMTNQSLGGTVIAVNIGEHYFLATAAHVISKDHEFNIVLKKKNALYIDSFLSKYVDDKSDIGLLEISKEYKHLIDPWITVSDICTDFDQHIENNVVVTGYPAQSIVRASREQITEGYFLETQICNALCCSSFTWPIKKWPSNGMEIQPLAGRDVFIDYDPGDMFASDPSKVDITPINSVRCPELPGISGGGIWLPLSESDTIWEPKVKLIGIEHSVFKRHGWIRGAHINCWLDLVSEKYPHLKPLIDQR